MEINTESKEVTRNESFALDLFRVVAIFFLVFGHGLSMFKPNQFKAITFPEFVYIQNVAVIILILLSGFLTHYSLFKRTMNESYSFFDYFKGRVLRIYPELILALIFVALIDWVLLKGTPSYQYLANLNVKTLLGNLLFLQKIPGFNIEPFGSARVLWTLSIEWWLYLSFAWFYIVLFKKKKWNILSISISGLLFYQIYQNLIRFINHDFRAIAFYWIMGWFAWSLFEAVKNINVSRMNLIIINSLLILCSLLYLMNTKEAYSIKFSVLMTLQIISGLLLINKVNLAPGFDRVIKQINSYTYSIYLIHYTVFLALMNLTKTVSPSLLMMIGIVLTLILSKIITLLADRHRNS